MYYVQDNSAWIITNLNGQLTNFYRYDAYGNLTNGSAGSVFGYAAQYQDTSTLYDMRARFYSPNTGLFIQRDPMYNQTDQAYAYAGGNPVNGSDPSGMSFNVYNGTSRLFKAINLNLNTSGSQFISEAGASGWRNNGSYVYGNSQIPIYSPIVQMSQDAGGNTSEMISNIGLALYVTWYNLYQTNPLSSPNAGRNVSTQQQFSYATAESFNGSASPSCSGVDSFSSYVSCFEGVFANFGNYIGGGSPEFAFPDLSMSWYVRRISSQWGANAIMTTLGSIIKTINKINDITGGLGLETSYRSSNSCNLI